MAFGKQCDGEEVLGDTIDLHAGEVDLEFPHHENEIAQSEVCLFFVMNTVPAVCGLIIKNWPLTLLHWTFK